jgi:cadmium resistance protein CadD (predicted permease)
MVTLIGAVIAATIAFAGANITDLFVLILFFSKQRLKPKEVVAGQYLGVGGLIVLCFVIATIGASFIPPEWTRLLGIVPIIVGLKSMFGEKDKTPDKVDEVPLPLFKVSAGTFEVASVAFADCSDNLAIFIPLLIRYDLIFKLVIVAVFLTLIGAWCAIAYQLTHHKRVGQHITYYGERIAPVILIGLGCFILLS